MNSNIPLTNLINSVTKAVEKGRIVKDAFPSALSFTFEEYTEFSILIPENSDLKIAASFIAENIKLCFSPATKYLYWRVRPDVALVKAKFLEGEKLQDRELIKFYARLLITDKEETHRANGKDLEPIEPIQLE